MGLQIHNLRASRLLGLALLSGACGGSQLAPYSPQEIEIRSKGATYDLALAHLQQKSVPLLDEDLEGGLLSTQWREQGGRQYHLQILISPVSTVVQLECRIQSNLELRACAVGSEYPQELVELASELHRVLEAGTSKSTSPAIETARE